MEFINRTNDFEKVTASINNYDVTYILAGKAFGLSSFLQELGNRLQQYRVFMLNTINGTDISKLLISDIIHSSERNDFKKMAEQELGEKSTSLLSAILQGIPYAGPVFSQLVESKEIPPIYAGNYSSAVEEIIFPYILKCVNHKQILILLDAAQNISEESYNLIANLAKIDGVKILLGITDTLSCNYIKLKNSIALYSSIEHNTLLFGQPEEKLILELAKHLGISLSNEEVKELLSQTQQNIHLIIDYMINMTNSDNKNFSFQEIDKAIISFLYICHFGLTPAVLKTLLSMSNVFCPNIDTELYAVLYNLEEHGCITKKVTENIEIYFIVSYYHPEIIQCINHFSDIFYYKNIVFDYYRRPGMNNTQENLELIYRLAIEFSDRHIKKYAISLLESKLLKGEYIPKDIIANAQLSKNNNREIELSVLYHTRERHYGEALNWIESLKGKRKNSRYLTLKSVLLNRVRRFSEAEELLLDNINTLNEPRILNTLLAYYTANCIHTNQKNKALQEYEKRKLQLCGTENWGYFLRNLASAVIFSEKENFYREAIENFGVYNDTYGIYSSKCNWGNALCIAKKEKTALPLLLEAEMGLQQYGPNHLHIVYNDLGVCYLMLGDIKNSHKYIALAEKLAYNRMPRLLTAINKACLLAIDNNIESSVQLLESIYNEVIAHPVLNVKRKYFTNRLLVEYLRGCNYYHDFYMQYMQYVNDYVNKTIIIEYQKLYDQSKQIKYLSEEWNSLFAPAGLAYWYVEPLKMI